jgi:hypothetical protein
LAGNQAYNFIFWGGRKGKIGEDGGEMEEKY